MQELLRCTTLFSSAMDHSVDAVISDVIARRTVQDYGTFR